MLDCTPYSQLFVNFRSTIFSLPDEILIFILTFVPIGELDTSVKRTYKRLNNVLSTNYVLWKYIKFDHLVTLTINVFLALLKHSRQFSTSCLPPGSVYNSSVLDVNYIFTTTFQRSHCLKQVSIVDSPLSALTFLRFATNLELLDVSG